MMNVFRHFELQKNGTPDRNGISYSATEVFLRFIQLGIDGFMVTWTIAHFLA
jgi:hypothetical protein